MPIGLSRNGVRQCEVAARKVISPHGSRVFKTLPRGALKFPQNDWQIANQWSKEKGFGGISKQIWAIRPKIIEIDRAISPDMQARIHEAHPELAFARLNKWTPLDSKHEAEGLGGAQAPIAARRIHEFRRLVAAFTRDWRKSG